MCINMQRGNDAEAISNIIYRFIIHDLIPSRLLFEFSWTTRGIKVNVYDSSLGLCKLENEILKEAKNARKLLKNHIFRPKNVIFERF